MDSTESSSLVEDVKLLRERVRTLEAREAARRRGVRVGVAAVLALTVSSLAYGQLRTFTANSPALASDVNFNFTQLRTWLEQKVGAVGSAEVRVQTGTTSNVTEAAGKALFVSALTSSPSQPILEVRHDNLTQGIAFGYNSITASGTAANVDLNISSKGTGNVFVNGPLDINYERISCLNRASGSVCSCSSGNQILGGGAYCSGNNEHVNTSFPNSSSSWQAWCEDNVGTNVNVDIYILCARIR